MGGTLTVTPASLTITANDAGKIYGAANPALSATYTGLVNGDASTVVTGASLSTSATSASNVGTYGIALGAASAGNYTITEVGGNLTVTPASLTITANDAGKIYGAANPALSATYTGLVNGDASTVVTGASLSTTATTASNVGTYGIALGAASAGNYTITEVGGTLTVTPATLLATVGNASRIYGSGDPTDTISYSGLVNGDTASVVSGISYVHTDTAGSNVGTYSIFGTGGHAGNYQIFYAAGSLTVTPASLTITANDAGKIYGAALPGLSATYTGLVNGDSSTVVTGASLSTTATSASNVGTYGIALGAASAGNYTITEVGGHLTVTPASLTITANDAGRLYSDADPVFTATFAGLVNGDASSVVTSLHVGANDYAGAPVGTYAITASGGVASNYALTYVAGALTVGKSVLYVEANDATRTYGSADPALTARYVGFVGGDNASVVSGLTLASADHAASGVGTYAITASGVDAANYIVSYVAGALTVTPASLTITANNATKLYGAANPALSATYTGLVNGDGPAAIAGVGLGAADSAASGVGRYAITASGGVDANYTITYVAGTMSVTPAPLTITAGNASRAAGQADPAFGASYAGLVNGDGTSVVTGLTLGASDGGAGAATGTYQIMPYGAAAQNYAISFVPGVLTVASALSGPVGQLIAGSSSILSQVVATQIALPSAIQVLSLPAQQSATLAFPLQSVINTLSDGSESGIGANAGTTTNATTCLKSTDDADCSGSLNVRGF